MTHHIKDSNFIINCAARTGSTFLLNLLRSNPQIMMHGEVLTPNGVGALTGVYGKKIRENAGFQALLDQALYADPKKFIYDQIFDKQARRVVGFKYKTDESLNPDFKPFSDIIFADKDIKVIMLYRRDLLAQYVSHQVVLKQTGVTLVKDKKNLPKVSPFKVDLKHIGVFFKDVTERENKAKDVYSNHRTFDIVYEDIVDPGHPSLRELQQFLGVRYHPLESNSLKIIKDNYALIKNLRRVKERLTNLGFTDRFRED